MTQQLQAHLNECGLACTQTGSALLPELSDCWRSKHSTQLTQAALAHNQDGHVLVHLHAVLFRAALLSAVFSKPCQLQTLTSSTQQ